MIRLEHGCFARIQSSTISYEGVLAYCLVVIFADAHCWKEAVGTCNAGGFLAKRELRLWS